MEPIDLLKKILGLTEEEDTAKWHRVAKLNPEDIMRRRTLDADEAKKKGEAEVLAARIHALRALSKAEGAEWWEHCHNTYSLPRGRNFTISDDGFILMEPKEDQGDNPRT
jgi:hypothetical protein